MSDERREAAWRKWAHGPQQLGPGSRSIQDGFEAGYDARNAEVEALKAALRKAREVLREYHGGCGVPDEPCLAREALAEIDAVLGAS